MIHPAILSVVGGKAEQLQIRVTADQKAALRRLARRAGLDRSAFVLARVLPAPRQRFAELVQAVAGVDRRFALAELNDLLSGLTSSELRAEPCFATPFPGLRLYLLRSSPVPFKRRNIFVDAAVGDRV